MGLVNALYGLGQVIISLDCTMNIIIAIETKWFPGTNQMLRDESIMLFSPPIIL